MPRQDRARDHAPAQLHHDEAQRVLLAYIYGRLAPREDAAVEAHIGACDQCRAMGLRHIMAERHHLWQQRPKKPRRGSRRAGMAILCAIFGLLVGLAGFTGVMVVHPNLLLHIHDRQIPNPTPAPAAATPTAPLPRAPTLQSQSRVTTMSAATLAWSANGALATAANPDPATGASGGVMTFIHTGHTWVGTRCPGFEGVAAPGTLAWSADGTQLAAAGRRRILLWQGATCQQGGSIALPTNPGGDLTVFDSVTGGVTQSAPASIFATTGYVAWGANGVIQSAAANATGSFAVWDGPQGARLFRDATGAVWLGMLDADVVAHAALLRWSPDGRYLLWGYLRPALLTTNGAATPLASALEAALPATAAWVAALRMALATQASLTFWVNTAHTQIASSDATQTPITWQIVDAQTGALLGSLPSVSNGVPARNGFVWRTDGDACVIAVPAVEILAAPHA